MLHGMLLPDRPFGEHVCFAFQFTILRQDFQRGKKIIRGIVGKCLHVGPAVDQPIFGSEAVIQGVQLCLKLMDRVII